MAELPDKLYVTMTDPGDGADYPDASLEPDMFDDGTIIGVYRLVTTRIVSKKTTLKRPDNTTEPDNGDE